MGFFTKRTPEPDDRYEALEAEYRNYRRRTAQELETRAQRAARATVLPFLSLWDDLDRALAAPCADEAFYRGVELIRRNLTDTLAGLGVRPMDSLGKCFNPTYHEAVAHVQDPSCRPEQIVEVRLTGFTMDEEVLRHAKVVVANCE